MVKKNQAVQQSSFCDLVRHFSLTYVKFVWFPVLLPWSLVCMLPSCLSHGIIRMRLLVDVFLFFIVMNYELQ
jgi:hypothetical protein